MHVSSLNLHKGWMSRLNTGMPIQKIFTKYMLTSSQLLLIWSKMNIIFRGNGQLMPPDCLGKTGN